MPTKEKKLAILWIDWGRKMRLCFSRYANNPFKQSALEDYTAITIIPSHKDCVRRSLDWKHRGWRSHNEHQTMFLREQGCRYNPHSSEQSLPINLFTDIQSGHLTDSFCDWWSVCDSAGVECILYTHPLIKTRKYVAYSCLLTSSIVFIGYWEGWLHVFPRSWSLSLVNLHSSSASR